MVAIKVWSLASLVALAANPVALACTSFAIPSSSMKDVAAVTAHTTDCSECDPRLALVPGRKWPEGSMHAVYGINSVYPRKSDGTRATIYQNVPKQEPVGYIPEVSETYGVWESSYTLMNEMGLTFGESSCSSKIPAAGRDMPDKDGNMGPAMFCVGALMQLGLERCPDAVCAIRVMGAAAEEYGFYGESLMGGETVTIADRKGQAWVFHVMQSYTSNSSAIWAAQRVPDGHAAVIANEFIIQEIPLDQEQVASGFMWSENIVSEAVAAGWWTQGADAPFNFQKVYGSKTVVGDNLYATMRQHWIYKTWAPSLNLELAMSPSGFNFSYPVDKALSMEDVLGALRGNYEGTEWDLTKGIFAGPFGNPKRIEGGPGLKAVKGAMPRPISIPRTSHVHIGFAHPDPSKSAALYGPDESGTTVYAPFFTSTLEKARHMPLNDTSALYSKYYQEGRRDVYGYRASAWWAFNIVANALNFNYQNMTAEFVKPAIAKHQSEMLALLRSGDESASVKAQNALVDAWWALYDKLVVTYNDGTFNFAANHNPKKPYEPFGYPESYLKDIAFDKDFWKTQTLDSVCTKRQAQESASQPAIPLQRWEDQPLMEIKITPNTLAHLAMMFAIYKSFPILVAYFASCLKTEAANRQPLLGKSSQAPLP